MATLKRGKSSRLANGICEIRKFDATLKWETTSNGESGKALGAKSGIQSWIYANFFFNASCIKKKKNCMGIPI